MARKIYENVTRVTAKTTEPVVSELENRGINPEQIPFEIISNVVKNPEVFAQRTEIREINIRPGITLTQDVYELGEDHFSNVYTLNLNSGFDAEIDIFDTELFQHRIFKNKPTVIASINGGFFCLHDGDANRYPKHIVYGANIQNGKIYGLPAFNRPVLYVTKDGELHFKEVQAQGEFKIGDEIFSWLGAEEIAHNDELMKKYEDDISDKILLFNSSCSSIVYKDKNSKASLRVLDESRNHTPKNPNKADIIISNNSGVLTIQQIVLGGGVDYFEGDFILHIPKKIISKFQIGKKLQILDIDGLDVNNLISAISTGPQVKHFLDNDDHPINHDTSLGTFPPFAPEARYARSVVYKTKDESIHLTVFDGVPRSQKMLGVTPREVAKYINKIPDVKWAVFMDGGQSSRITFKNENNKLDFRGNKQYLRLHKLDKKSQAPSVDGRYFWSARGRPVPSAITFKVSNKT